MQLTPQCAAIALLGRRHCTGFHYMCSSLWISICSLLHLLLTALVTSVVGQCVSGIGYLLNLFCAEKGGVLVVLHC